MQVSLMLGEKLFKSLPISDTNLPEQPLGPRGVWLDLLHRHVPSYLTNSQIPLEVTRETKKVSESFEVTSLLKWSSPKFRCEPIGIQESSLLYRAISGDLCTTLALIFFACSEGHLVPTMGNSRPSSHGGLAAFLIAAMTIRAVNYILAMNCLSFPSCQ
jgi:hypothetical protein